MLWGGGLAPVPRDRTQELTQQACRGRETPGSDGFIYWNWTRQEEGGWVNLTQIQSKNKRMDLFSLCLYRILSSPFHEFLTDTGSFFLNKPRINLDATSAAPPGTECSTHLNSTTWHRGQMHDQAVTLIMLITKPVLLGLGSFLGFEHTLV